MSALTCPNCGAVHERKNPGIVVIVCTRCDSTLYLEDEVVAQGEKSVVGEPSSGIRVGATGRVDKVGVEVLGRVRLTHARGSWDEWYVRCADGRDRWLVEDEKTYTLEDPLTTPPAGARPGMQVGDTLEYLGATYEVRETGEARLDGGEGQLPRRIQTGGTYGFADLHEVGGERAMLLEFDPDGEVEAFSGRTIPAQEVKIEGAWRPAEGAATAKDISCAACGAPFTLRPQADPVKTASCPHCDELLALNGSAAKALGKVGKAPAFALDVGDTAQLIDDNSWEVMGRTNYRDPEGYETQEFLLFCAAEGYAWLEYDNGHFSFLRATDVGPAFSKLRYAGAGSKVKIGGIKYTIRARGSSELKYVDGALPWEARLGDQQQFWDMSDPPYLFAAEFSGTEVEYFKGEYLAPKPVFAAFDRSRRYKRPRAVHYGQPNPYTIWQLAGAAGIFIALLNLLAVVGGAFMQGSEIVRFTVPKGTTGVASVESQTFELDPADGAVIGVLYESNTDNSWVWVDLEFLDAATEETVGYLGEEIEYYHGVEGGESWSEGSRKGSKWLKTPPKGKYLLSGTLEYDHPTPVTIKVTQGGFLSRYNCCLIFPFGVLGFLLIGRAAAFENKRKEDA